MKTEQPDQPDASRLNAHGLTWAGLLSRWVEFARSAVALPDNSEGRLLRDSVPDLIMLQAVFFALKETNDLTPDERALGVDRAQVLIERHAGALRSRWAGDDLPPQMLELIADARRQLAEASGDDSDDAPS